MCQMSFSFDFLMDQQPSKTMPYESPFHSNWVRIKKSSLHVGAVSVGLICFPFGGPSSDTFLHTLVWFGTQTLGVILVIFKGKSSSAFTLLPLVSYCFQQSSDIAKDTKITGMQIILGIVYQNENSCKKGKVWA